MKSMLRRATSIGLLVASLLGAETAHSAPPPPNLAMHEALARQDYAAVLSMARPLAEKDDAQGENYLGLLYLRGWGVAQDYSAAVGWYQKAATQGVMAAQVNLGSLYMAGHGVPQDYAQAAYWFGKAADQGAPQAFYNLGILYEDGLGVQQDYKAAAQWFRKAAQISFEPPRQEPGNSTAPRN